MSAFKPMETASPADRSQHHSYFKTTYKYQFYHWLSNLIILPTYFLIIYLLLSALDRKLCGLSFPYLCTATRLQQGPFFDSHIASWLYWTIILTSIAPPILSLTAINRPWWRSGFRSRGQLIFISSILSVYINMNLPILSHFTHAYFISFAFTDFLVPESIIKIYFGLFLFLIISGCITGFWLMQLGMRRLTITTAISSALTLFLIYRNFTPLISMFVTKYGPIFLQILVILPSLVVMILMPAFRIARYRDMFISTNILSKQNRQRIYSNNQRWPSIAISWILLITSFLAIATSIYKNDHLLPISTFILWFMAIFLSAHPDLFLSRQRAYIRNLFASMRHDHLRNLVTPLLDRAHPINKITYQFNRLILNNWSLIIFFGS
jgi:hypothetical protein